jgi:hypothetical protein
MGLFSKSPKSNPKIIWDEIACEFHRDHDWWEFDYRGANFRSFESTLILPTKAELDAIVSTIATLMPAMQERMKNGLKEWGDAKTDGNEQFSVDVKNFSKEGTFSVSWSGGEVWGDLGVDFTIKNNIIVDESWGD